MCRGMQAGVVCGKVELGGHLALVAFRVTHLGDSCDGLILGLRLSLRFTALSNDYIKSY